MVVYSKRVSNISSGALFIIGLFGSGMTIPNSMAVPENAGYTTRVSVLSCSEYIRNTWTSSSGVMMYPGGVNGGWHAAYTDVPNPASASVSNTATVMRVGIVKISQLSCHTII